MVSLFFHPLKWHRFFNCHVFVDARLLLHFGWQLANSAHRLPAPQVVIRQLEVSIASGMSVCCFLHSTNCAAFGWGVDDAGAQAWADYEVFWSKVPWFNGPAVPRSRVHGPGPAMAEQQLDLNAAAEALAEAVVGAVAAVDAQAPAEPPAVPAPGVQEVVPQGSAEIANQVLRQGIQISPAVIGLTSDRIVEHYGCLG